MKHRHFPRYNDDADFTTNAPSYYEDLARKEKLIRLLAERIWGYEKILDDTLEEIQERFHAWDKNLEDFPDDVKALLQQWLDDGTLDHIINDTIFNWKLDTSIFEQFRDSVTAQLQQTEQELSSQLSLTENELKSHFINVKFPPSTLESAKGDGITDDGQAINAILQYASNNNLKVFFPNGIYPTTIPIVWDGRTTVTGIGSESVIKAIAPMTYLVTVDKSNTDIYDNGTMITGRWNEIDINGNHLADVAMYVKRGKGLNIGHMNINSGKRVNLLLGDETPGTLEKAWEAIIHDIYLRGGSGADRPDYNVKITNRFVDSEIRDIIPTSAKISSFYNEGGALLIDSLHPYVYPASDASETLVYAGGEACRWTNLYLDTPGKTALDIANYGNTFNNIYIVTAGFLDSVSEKDIIRISETGNILSNVVINFPASVNPQAQMVLVNAVTVDNSNGNISGLFLTNIEVVGVAPKRNIKMMGKVPERFTHNLKMRGIEKYPIGQEIFRHVVYKSELFTDVTFKHELTDTYYTIDVEMPWNSNWWVTNKTTTGFRINFNAKPETENKTISIKATPYYNV